MIFSLLAKYWKSILDTLIVVAIVIVVFILNPWNMFGGGLKTNQTANNISAIREIGELITAEYYGEVISTIDQSRLRMIYSDDVNAQADVIFRQIKQDLLSFYSTKLESLDSEKKDGLWTFKWFRRAKKEKKELISGINQILTITNTYTDNDTLYKNIIEYIWLVESKSAKKINQELKPKERNNAFWLLYQKVTLAAENLSDIDFDTYMNAGLPEYNKQVFSDFYYQKKADLLSNKEERKELSMVGRGWVKAGFNFEKLDENNFIFDKENAVVHLFGVHAEILNADINPWFIPEKKIPGFQIIESNRHVDFNDAVIVKKYCVEKLRKMALDAGILEQAEINGKEVLKSFVSLLSGIEVKEVYFYYDPFSVYTKEILSDKFISYSESRMLDTLIRNQFDSIIKLDRAKKDYQSKQAIKEVKISQLQAAIAQMRNCWFEEPRKYYNRLSSIIFRIAADSILTHNELNELKAYRWEISKTLKYRNYKESLENKVWYKNELEFINEYNNAIAELKSKTKHFANCTDTLFSDTEALNRFLTINKIAVSEQIEVKHYNSSVLLSYIENVYNATRLDSIKYTIDVAYNWQEQLNNKMNISFTNNVKTSKSIDTIQIGKTILSQIAIDTSTISAYKVIAINKLDDDYWAISDSLEISDDENMFVEFLINKYIQTESVGFFTKANKRIREVLNQDAIQKRTASIQKKLQDFIPN